jgi:hypothetical protein
MPALALALVGAMATPGVGDPKGRDDLNEISDEMVARERSFRSDLGFTTSDKHIRELLAERLAQPQVSPHEEGKDSAYRIAAALPYVFSQSESQELAHRIEMQDLLPELEARLHRASIPIAGSMVDHHDEGRVIIVVTQDLDRTRKMAQNTLGTSRFRVEQVPYTREDLNRAEHLLRESAPMLGLMHGSEIVGLKPNWREGILGVMIEGVRNARLEAKLQSMADVPVEITYGPRPVAHRSSWSPPIRGGIRLRIAGSWCTSGFVARSSAATYRLLTAGHCGGIAPVGTPVTWGGVQVGTVRSNAYHGTTNTDSMTISMSSSFASNWIYLNSASQQHPITSTASPAQENPGAIVCMSGYNSPGASGSNCGTVVTNGWSFPTEHGRWLTDAVSATFAGTGGDSGAPVYRHSRAHGIYFGRNPVTGNTVYTRILNAINAHSDVTGLVLN